MKTDTQEYLPTADEFGNGRTNGHPKKFNLQPAEDPEKQIVYETRNQCHHDKELSYGARFYFAYLLDRALDNRTWAFRGAVLISVRRLRRLIGCSLRVVYSWNKQLVARRYIWISKSSISSNMDPFNVYHISAIHPPRAAAQKLSHDGMWGTDGPRVYKKPFAGPGARARNKSEESHAENAPVALAENGHISNVLPVSASDRCTNGSVSHAENATGSRNGCDGESQNLRRGAVENATGSRKDCISPSQKRALITHTVVGNSSVKSTSKTISKGLKRFEDGEREFLEKMIRLAVTNDGEKSAMQQAKSFGRQWRARFREDPEKAERCYLDTLETSKNGEITGNVGKCWNNRWGQFATRKEVAK